MKDEKIRQDYQKYLKRINNRKDLGVSFKRFKEIYKFIIEKEKEE